MADDKPAEVVDTNEGDESKEEEIKVTGDPLLPKLDSIVTHEEDEEILTKMRAKLYRFDQEWKERGTGEVKFLKHKETGKIRLLMRRDKILKVCMNHYITADMKLESHCGSDKAWVWSTAGDFSEEKPEPELFAIRFANPEIASEFKTAFADAQKALGGTDAAPDAATAEAAE